MSPSTADWSGIIPRMNIFQPMSLKKATTLAFCFYLLILTYMLAILRFSSSRSQQSLAEMTLFSDNQPDVVLETESHLAPRAIITPNGCHWNSTIAPKEDGSGVGTPIGFMAGMIVALICGMIIAALIAFPWAAYRTKRKKGARGGGQQQMM